MPATAAAVAVAVWIAFSVGICLSLCANVAAVPELSVFAVVVTACSPLALLLAGELLYRALKRHHSTQTVTETSVETAEIDETTSVVRLAVVLGESRCRPSRPPSTGCGSTTSRNGRSAAHRPARRWMGSPARTTTVARCYDGGRAQAGSATAIQPTAATPIGQRWRPVVVVT